MVETLNNSDLMNIIKILPFGIMIIDKEKKIRFMNQRIIDNYGDLTNEFLEMSNLKIYKPDIIEHINEVFETGLEVNNMLSPFDKKGKLTYQSINYYPVKDDYNNIENILVLVSDDNDNNNTNIWLKEFNLLFENAPSFISIVDKDYKIVRANQRFRNTFSNNLSIFSNDPNKRKIELNTNATAMTFNDSQEHIDTVVAYNINKEKLNLIVTTMPFNMKDGDVDLVMEMSSDITEISRLQDRIKDTHDFYVHLIENSSDGIIAIDAKNKIQIINQAAKNILGFNNKKKPVLSVIKDMLPQIIYNDANEEGTIVENYDYEVIDNNGIATKLRFNAFEIRNKKKLFGKVIFFRVV